MSKNHSKLTTMAGEIFDIQVTQMSKNHLKSSTMVVENVENHLA